MPQFATPRPTSASPPSPWPSHALRQMPRGSLCTGQGATQALRGQTLHQDLRLWPSPDSTVPTAIDAHSCGTAPATSPQQRGQCWRARGRPDTHVTGSSPGPEPKSARQRSCESFLTKREAPGRDGPTAPRLSLECQHGDVHSALCSASHRPCFRVWPHSAGTQTGEPLSGSRLTPDISRL